MENSDIFSISTNVKGYLLMHVGHIMSYHVHGHVNNARARDTEHTVFKTD